MANGFQSFDGGFRVRHFVRLRTERGVELKNGHVLAIALKATREGERERQTVTGQRRVYFCVRFGRRLSPPLAKAPFTEYHSLNSVQRFTHFDLAFEQDEQRFIIETRDFFVDLVERILLLREE